MASVSPRLGPTRVGARVRLTLLAAGFSALVPTGCGPNDSRAAPAGRAALPLPHTDAAGGPAVGGGTPVAVQVATAPTTAPVVSPAQPAGSPIRLEGAWIRAGQAGGTTALYTTIRNAGASADTLVGAACEAADTVEVHRSFMDGTMMRMVPAGDVPLPAGEQVNLEPGGLHIMLIGLRGDLAEGARLPVTLRFARAGEVTVVADVRPRTGM